VTRLLPGSPSKVCPGRSTDSERSSGHDSGLTTVSGSAAGGRPGPSSLLATAISVGLGWPPSREGSDPSGGAAPSSTSCGGGLETGTEATPFSTSRTGRGVGCLGAIVLDSLPGQFGGEC